MLSTQPILDDKEWSLVLALLQGERRELPTEIHHTDSADYADQLHERQAVIESLIERLRAQGVTA